MFKEQTSKSLFWTLLNASLVVVIVFGLIGTGTLIRYSNAIVPSRTITITGEGKTQITPDVATYSFSVVSEGVDPDRIQQQNTEKMNAAIAFVKQQGVAAADIKTTGYNLYPRYRYEKDSGRSSIDGYELTQTVSLKIRDLGKVGTILGGLVKAGVNQAGSLQYAIDDPEAQREEARKEAFAHAYRKARQMAAQSGVELARVVSFSESSYNDRPMPFYGVAMGKGGEAAVPATEPGTEEVAITVSVTYEIR